MKLNKPIRFIAIMIIIGIITGGVSAYLLAPPKVKIVYKDKIIEKVEIKEKIIYRNIVKTIDVKEMSILLKIVEAEATGGTIKQKENVTACILNRVENENFPNTIEKVVFQKNQFSPISDKRYYSVKVSDTTIKAVSNVLNGDNRHSSLYFMYRKGSDKNNIEWFDEKLTFTFYDGAHEYFR